MVGMEKKKRKNRRNNRREQLGYLLQRERKCQRIVQEKLAQKLSLTQEKISKIESGTRRLDTTELMKYCEALNITPSMIGAKIETYFFSQGLLPRPIIKSLDESNTTKKIRLDVQWCDTNFEAAISDKVFEATALAAKTFEELKKEAHETLRLYVEGMIEDVKEVPRWLRDGDYELEYNFLDAHSLLKAYSPYVSLAAISRVSGINQSQLSLYANGKKVARPYQIQLIKDAIHKIGKELMAVVLCKGRSLFEY